MRWRMEEGWDGKMLAFYARLWEDESHKQKAENQWGMSPAGGWHSWQVGLDRLGLSEGKAHVGNIQSRWRANSQEVKWLKRFQSQLWTSSGAGTLIPAWSLWEIEEQGCKSVVQECPLLGSETDGVEVMESQVPKPKHIWSHLYVFLILQMT